MRDVDLAWLAGLLEGEGCFSSQKKMHGIYPRIRLLMTDEDVVRRAADLLGRKVNRFTRGDFKPQYAVDVAGMDAVNLMKSVYPYMGKRRKQIIDNVLENYHGYRRGFHEPALGESHPNHKLIPAQVRVIRKRLQAKESKSSIARDFNVSARAIGLIDTGRTWGWLE